MQYDCTDVGYLMRNMTDDDRASYWWFSKLFPHDLFYALCNRFDGDVICSENI